MREAQRWLASYLGVPVGFVGVVEVEQVDWPDACLGLAQSGENCAQVITPGYRIIFDVRGERYEVRTNLEGTIIRLAQDQMGSPDTGYQPENTQ